MWNLKNRLFLFILSLFMTVLLVTACLNPAAEKPDGPGSVREPVFNLESGEYDRDIQIVLAAHSSDVNVHYTTDGTIPGRASAVYSTPIPVTGNGDVVMIKAVSITKEGIRSRVVAKHYTVKYEVKVATPKLSPREGLYLTAQDVTITCATEGAVIRYTRDGSKPNAFSPIYVEPIRVNEWETVTIKAVAYKEGLHSSSHAIGDYTIQPTFKRAGRGVLIGLKEVYFDWVTLTNLFDVAVDQNSIYQLTLASHDDQDDYIYSGLADYSPDRTGIVFNYLFRGNGIGSDTLCTINADGTNRREIFRLFTDFDVNGTVTDLDWAPDGSKIAFSGTYVRDWSDNGIFLINPDGSGVEKLTDDGEFPCWSRDSTKLVFVRTGKLWIMMRNGSGAFQIPAQSTVNSYPDFHPLEDKIAYSAKIDGQWDLFIMNTDGSNVIRLTDTPSYDELYPDWAPDLSEWPSYSESLVYLREETGVYGSGVLCHIDTASPFSVTEVAAGATGRPSW